MTSSLSEITISVQLFAAYQEIIGQPLVVQAVPAGTTVGQLLDQVLCHYPALEPWRLQTRFGVNCQFVPSDQVLKAGDEVVFIPPVSGG